MRFGRRPRRSPRAATRVRATEALIPALCTAAVGRWRPRGHCIRQTAVAPFQPPSCRYKVNGDEYQ